MPNAYSWTGQNWDLNPGLLIRKTMLYHLSSLSALFVSAKSRGSSGQIAVLEGLPGSPLKYIKNLTVSAKFSAKDVSSKDALSGKANSRHLRSFPPAPRASEGSHI